MTLACHHIGIFTEDPRQLILFYTQRLDFVETETRVLSSDLTEKIFKIKSECQLTKLTRDKAVIEIFSPMNSALEERGVRTKGYNHWALAVEDKEFFIRICERRDVPVLKIEHNGRMIFFIADPEGNLIEIYEPKK